MLDIDLGPACHLTGEVLDASDAGVFDAEVWLLPDTDKFARQIQPAHESECLAKSRSDARGQFDLGEVAAGRYRVGLGVSAVSAVGSSDGIAMRTMPVEVLDGESSKELVLRVDRGLYLRGRVLLPDGTPAAHLAQVMCFHSPGYYEGGRSDADGVFSVGPLIAGEYKLIAMASEFVNSLELKADAGASDLVLQLRAGVSLAGRVVSSPGGAGVSASITVRFDEDQRPGLKIDKTNDSGEFSIAGIQPGDVGLIATASDGRVGVLTMSNLSAGAAMTNLEVLLAPSARLRMRRGPEDPALIYYVRQNGAIVLYGSTAGNGDRPAHVPPGELHISLYQVAGGAPSEQTVFLAAGEEREIVFSREQ
jgi:hypothetical protein